MTITNFAELRRAVLHDTQLSTDLFGERVTVEPEHGAGREISAHVSHMQRQQETEASIDEMESLEVRVGTDESNTDVGGIADPKPGLLLWRSEANDPDRRPFQFNGNILRRFPHKLILEFERTKRTAQGRGV